MQTRPEAIAYVAFGGNQGDVASILRHAFASLDAAPQCRISAISPWYRSAAVGPGTQPDYLNGVIELRTTLAPLPLLDLLQALEIAAGRVRTLRWAARTLDLDLLLYDDLVLNDARLTLPHPRLEERNFVVYPLHDLAPALILPGGTPLASQRLRLGAGGLQRLQGIAETLDG